MSIVQLRGGLKTQDPDTKARPISEGSKRLPRDQDLNIARSLVQLLWSWSYAYITYMATVPHTRLKRPDEGLLVYGR